MDKFVTLVANTKVPYGGRVYGLGMQFRCEESDAASLVASQQASRVPTKVSPPAAKPEPAAAVDAKADVEPKK